jgi:hypothetical protein
MPKENLMGQKTRTLTMEIRGKGVTSLIEYREEKGRRANKPLIWLLAKKKLGPRPHLY